MLGQLSIFILWLNPKLARSSESCVLIGYQAGEEGLSYLRISSEFLALFAQEKIFLCPFWPYNIVFIERRSRYVMLP